MDGPTLGTIPETAESLNQMEPSINGEISKVDFQPAISEKDNTVGSARSKIPQLDSQPSRPSTDEMPDQPTQSDSSSPRKSIPRTQSDGSQASQSIPAQNPYSPPRTSHTSPASTNSLAKPSTVFTPPVPHEPASPNLAGRVVRSNPSVSIADLIPVKPAGSRSRPTPTISDMLRRHSRRITPPQELIAVREPSDIRIYDIRRGGDLRYLHSASRIPGHDVIEYDPSAESWQVVSK